MNRIPLRRIAALCLLLSLVFMGCSAPELIGERPAQTAAAEPQITEPQITEPEKTEPEKTANEKEQTPMKILLIGNSYTYYNNMPETLLYRLMQEAGVRLSVRHVTKGGQYLIDSADPTNVLGKKVDAALNAQAYDLVVLQEQSLCPTVNPQKFFTGVRRLTEKIRQKSENVLLYATWGRKPGNGMLEKYGLTHESMTWRQAAAYTAIAEEIGAGVAYVGLAFADVLIHHGDTIELYKEDRSHPSRAGSFLAALTLAAEITGVDPTTLSFDADLSPGTAAILKEAARKAVFETPAIPEEYRISSADYPSL